VGDGGNKKRKKGEKKLKNKKLRISKKKRRMGKTEKMKIVEGEKKKGVYTKKTPTKKKSLNKRQI